ncbi:MAG: hypothetical protein JSU65_05600 [Candidatus Zixiibacteriota bacterium]|nr:MAG: hypothetical protein JSU65_05600 [candidate division Zixibacteria bacterium]
MLLDTRFASRCSVLGVILVIMLAFAAPEAGKAQIPDLIITVGDTVGSSGQKNSVITVYMDNFFDTVVAFELWLKVGNTSILEFQNDSITVHDTTYWICAAYDGPNCTQWVGADDSITYWVCDEWDGSTCVDSTRVNFEDPWEWSVEADSMDVYIHDVEVGSFDTTGTLISNWEYLTSRAVIGGGVDLKVTGVADRFTVPGGVPGIAPQQGGVLFRLLADIFPIDDTVSERTSAIIPDPFRDHFSFSRPDGSTIGLSDSLRVDTNCWKCESWVPPDSVVCLDWVKVGEGPCDSVDIEIDTVTYVDTAKCKLYPGSLTVLPGVCGEIDNDPLGEIDIGDLTYLISYLFLNGPEPDPMGSADVDCVHGIPPVDIGDLTYMISFLFIDGTAPCDCE